MPTIFLIDSHFPNLSFFLTYVFFSGKREKIKTIVFFFRFFLFKGSQSFSANFILAEEFP